MSQIAERLAQVEERIQAAATSAGRDRNEITLVAVSKTWPLETLIEAFEAGVRHFGENRTHELLAKRPGFPHAEATWHYIGHLQSRQSQAVADLADVFHAIDRPKIINRLGQQLTTNGRSLKVFLEVNVSGESSKGGFNAAHWEENRTQLDELVTAAKTIADHPGYQLQGLMTMAPWGAAPVVIQSVFQRTWALRNALQERLDQSLPALSMGMTDDFELAIAGGATHIRVGRAIFGERQ